MGTAGLTAAWQAGADWDLILAGSGLPCLGGGVHSWAPGGGVPRMWHLSLAFIGDTFRDAAWRDGLRAFFTAVADRAPTPAAGLGHTWFPRRLRARPGLLGPRPAHLRPAELLAGPEGSGPRAAPPGQA